ncbi:HEXXH motif-containing protein [Kutzneria buriramensis]|uniref:HEXXH motif-containing protein n=1 Tax=Kutzneria buriramensis TaxID=1045776 RepID=A0A3E0H2X8_9PSEU|nr:HEXXH motif-containing protein [Kutzneria buriramensis]
MLLRAVLQYARQQSDCTGPLPPVDVAWQVLADAQRRNPHVVADLLSHPQVGMWTAHALRRFRGVAEDSAPLWFHVGYLHTLAATAAARAGLAVRITIPCHDGAVVLPTLGCVTLPVDDEWTVATVSTADETAEITVGAAAVRVGGPGWRPTPTVGKVPRIRLDDVDPYRGLDHPMPADPLPDNEIAQWHALMDEAWSMLSAKHADQAAELAAGMRAVVPIASTARFRTHSASVENGFGGPLISRPTDAGVLAVTLVHEFQHSKLTAVQHLVPLLAGTFPAVHHAPWRDDPRPPSGLLQGVYAFTAVTEFWAAHRDDNPLAQFEFAHWRGQTLATLRELRAHPILTDLGRRFVDVVATRLEPLQSLAVPEDVGALAEATALDHQAAWQVRHLRPSTKYVDAATDAWLAERSVPEGYTATVVPAATVQRIDVKAVLSRVRIIEPATFDELRSAPSTITDAAAADFAYLVGDPDTSGLYQQEIEADSGRAGAWSGLGLSLWAAGSPAAEALLRRPELVRAIYVKASQRSRRAPDIQELAAWVGV